MNRWTSIPLVAAALAFPASASAYEYRANLTVAPNQMDTAQSQVIPSRVKTWNRVDAWVDGKLAELAVYRQCAVDLVARRVLITVDACGKRVKVSAATTGTVERHVRVLMSTKKR